MKKIILLSFLSLILMTGCGCNKKEDNGNDENNIVENPNIMQTPEMLENQVIQELEFKCTNLTYDGNITSLESQVTNTSDKTITLSIVIVTIKYLSAESNRYSELEMEIDFGESIQPGETLSALNTVNANLGKALSIDYRIAK